MTKQNVRVGVLFGGKSGEHEVSLNSARTVIHALDEAGYETVRLGIGPDGRWLLGGDPLARLTDDSQSPGPAHSPNGSRATAVMPLFPQAEQMPRMDVLFPVLHGPFGEDGTVQGLLEMADLPYVGCGVLASAVGMDKAVSKTLFAAVGLPQVAYRTLLRRDWEARCQPILDGLEAALPYPLFVKPANLGSSVGVSKAGNRQALAQAIDFACCYDRKVLVEAGVTKARELEVSVLGNDDPQASVVGEIIPANEFYDYEAKYADAGSRLLIPAEIGAELAEQIRQSAVRAFQALDCTGLARVDFLLGEDGALFLNELNTMPGFTASSMYPKLWEASGVPLPALVQRLVELALERHADRQKNRTYR